MKRFKLTLSFVVAIGLVVAMAVSAGVNIYTGTITINAKSRTDAMLHISGPQLININGWSNLYVRLDCTSENGATSGSDTDSLHISFLFQDMDTVTDSVLTIPTTDLDTSMFIERWWAAENYALDSLFQLGAFGVMGLRFNFYDTLEDAATVNPAWPDTFTFDWQVMGW